MSILRAHLTLLLSAFCALSLSQAFEQKISYQNQGANIDQVIEDLSEQSGVPMDVGRSLKGEVLVVSVKDAPLVDLMKRIADALNAEWTKSGETYRIIRSVNAVRKQDEKERAITLAMLTERLQQNQKALAAMEPFDEKKADNLARLANTFEESAARNMQALFTLMDEAPVARFGKRLLPNLDPQILSYAIQLAQTEKRPIVLSLNPTGNQLPLRLQNDQAIEQYVVEQNLYSESLRKLLIKKSYSSDPYLGIPDIHDLAHVYVIVTSSAAANANVEVRLFDSSMSLIASNRMSLGNVMRAQERVELYTALGEGEELIQLSPESTEIAAFLNSIDSERMKLGDELHQQLLDPEHYDPLRFVIGDALVKIAQQKNAQLVASPADPSFMYWSLLRPNTGTIAPKGFINWLEQYCHVDWDEDWLIIKPQSTQRERVDREVLARFLQKADKQGGVRLDDMLQLSIQVPQSSRVVWFYLHAITPELGQSISSIASDYVRAIATLPPSQLTALKQGQKLYIGNLPAFKQQEFMKVVGESGAAFEEGTSAGKPIDPLISFASGLPPDTYLEFEHRGPSKSYRFVEPEGIKGVSREMPLSEEQLPQVLGRVAHIFKEEIPKDTLLYQGEMTRWDIIMQLGNGFKQRIVLTESIFPPTNAKVRISDFPKEFFETIEAEKEKTREMLEKLEQGRPPARKP